MTHKNLAAHLAALIGALSLAMPWLAHAQATASDDFTQNTDQNLWKTFGGACLTAGDGTGSIPACVGLPYYQNQIQVGGSKGYLGQTSTPSSGASGVQTPDAKGSGALRLTNGYTAGTSGFMYGYLQAGAIISSGPAFNNSSGVNIIFKTITYLGNSGNGDGADGMGFFLMDGSKSPYDVGAFGGSLGYSCSNTNNDSATRADGTVRGYDGLAYGYIGLGMDEYGNFLNAGDNTATGPNQTPGRIGLRGAGSISWAQLYAAYPGYYPAASYLGASNQANRAAAVQQVCSTGQLWDYSVLTGGDNPGPTPRGTIADYGAIAGGSVVLSSILSGKLIAAESAKTRGAATPITYNLKITQNGLLSLSMAYGNGAYIPVITKQDITSTNGTPPATFRFGFAGSTGGSNNVHEVLCFQAAPVDVAGTSVGVNQKEATKIASGTQAYLANYYPNDWTGRLTASTITYDKTTQTVGISAISNWDAQCNLTGVPAGTTGGVPNSCPTTNAPAPITAQAPLGGGAVSSSAPLNRSLITWSGSGGVAFEWSGSSTITSTQKGTLTLNDATSNANRLNYLRGDRTNEINTLGVGLFRGRDGVLGDIIDSSPTWVGAPNSAYSAVWADKIPANVADTISENGGTQNYSAFIAAQQTRLNVVYDGANDGFMHAFRTGSYDTSGNYVTTLNDGQEILAYMPSLVLQNIHNSDPTQDYSNPNYSHNYFVNATPGTGDLFYNGTWHSWLAGGLGAGGAGLYILDITTPANFSEANAGSIVIGDWTSSTLSCANANTTACGNHLGSTYGTPVIRRLHDGKWGVIFGNGFGSTACDAGIFIMTVNPNTGKIDNTYYFGTGTGTCPTTSPVSAGSPNGIAFVTPVDIDTDHIVDYVYAGDLLGNVWRFDLTSTSESSWGTTASSPLFTTGTGTGPLPITSKLLVAIQPQTTGLPRLMVEFGTGRKFPLTNTSPVTYAPGTQYLYGIWDWNMSSWNGLSATKLASLTGPQTISASTLTTQTLTLQSSGILDGSSNTICWAGSTACTSGNTQFGFSIALPNSNEQVVYSPLLFQNAFLVNTTIPAVNSPTSCLITQDGGDTIAISVASGGAIPGFFKNTTDTSAAGTSTGGTGTPFMLQAGGQSFMLTQTNATCTGSSCPSNPIFNCKTNPNAAYCSTSTSTATPTGKRLTWIERR